MKLFSRDPILCFLLPILVLCQQTFLLFLSRLVRASLLSTIDFHCPKYAASAKNWLSMAE